MLTIDLDHRELEILRIVLRDAISDIGMEIAGTEAQDFRDRLKERRDVLNKVVAEIDRQAAT